MSKIDDLRNLCNRHGLFFFNTLIYTDKKTERQKYIYIYIYIYNIYIYIDIDVDIDREIDRCCCKCIVSECT